MHVAYTEMFKFTFMYEGCKIYDMLQSKKHQQFFGAFNKSLLPSGCYIYIIHRGGTLDTRGLLQLFTYFKAPILNKSQLLDRIPEYRSIELISMKVFFAGHFILLQPSTQCRFSLILKLSAI